MPTPGKCPNRAGCLLAERDEIISVADDAPFICPECNKPLIPCIPAKGKPVAIPVLILGGISLLIIMGSAAVYIRVRSLGEAAPPGQIGTSFEQAQVAAQHGEFLPSRHMVIDTPSPQPAASGQPQSPPATPP